VISLLFPLYFSILAASARLEHANQTTIQISQHTIKSSSRMHKESIMAAEVVTAIDLVSKKGWAASPQVLVNLFI
jgi:hypothetical protein